MITLDPCSPADLDDFLALALDPRMTARIGDGTPWSRETSVARYRRGMACCARGEGLWFLARDGGGLVGLVLAELDHLAEIEIGIWIAPDHWGQGHGRALLGLLLPVVGLRFPGLLPTAYAKVDHAASAAMLRAAGFTEDRTLVGRYGTEVTRFVLR